MKSNLIAPCGMNCNLCLAYLRDKNKCPGCNMDGKTKPAYCLRCFVKNCEVIKNKNWKYCSPNCDKFPCERLKKLDKRYKTKYTMSMIENLQFIENNGIRKFLQYEKEKWIKNGKIFCVHNKKYFDVKWMKK